MQKRYALAMTDIEMLAAISKNDSILHRRRNQKNAE